MNTLNSKQKFKLMNFKKIFLPILLFSLLFLSACNDSNSQNNSTKKTSQINKPENTTHMFTGKYFAAYENAAISAEITEDQNVIRGYFYMDGVQNEIIATSQSNTFQGKILDRQKEIFYDISAILKDDVLYFSITFPELDNQVIELILNKTDHLESQPNPNLNPVTQSNDKVRDQRLIGTWRYTEVLSSGNGDFYTSLATDYFIQFKANGECLSWSGSSAGGSSDVSLESRGNSNVYVEKWYTEGKNVIFYDPKTHEEVSIPFFAEENRMMLKGGSSKVYERVN